MSLEGTEPESNEPWALLRSQLECPKCHDILASIHRHDFQTCSCGETSLDGGLDYMRVAGNWMITASDEQRKALNHCIFIAGPHNRDSKALALAIYKALWKASARGERWASTGEVRAMMATVGNGKVPTTQQVIIYLDMFLDAEQVSKTLGRGYQWKPLVKLVERPDAP